MARDSLYPVSVKAGKPILGMLPTGWQKLSLEKCLNIEARKAYIQDNQEYDLVTVKRSRGGVIRREHLKEGANKRGNSSRLTQSFHFFMFEPIFSPVNALNQPI
ncbi:hypothetical protein [Escherichia coli]|uniref:hypothetical protein n=1 Tax=Escherichia coli TaxID=562 RepID=UPI00287587FF|nr:hypothetical protein [Escherichia coli]MDS1268577.1 hypothetical protein [Escherichia coli]